MIDFELSASAKGIREMVHAVADGVMRPISRKYDEEEHSIPWSSSTSCGRRRRAATPTSVRGTGRAPVASLLLEKWMRDAKINDIFEGTQQINMVIVARRILDYSSRELS